MRSHHPVLLWVAQVTPAHTGVPSGYSEQLENAGQPEAAASSCQGQQGRTQPNFSHSLIWVGGGEGNLGAQQQTPAYRATRLKFLLHSRVALVATEHPTGHHAVEVCLSPSTLTALPFGTAAGNREGRFICTVKGQVCIKNICQKIWQSQGTGRHRINAFSQC